jgi:hypothetical protein
MQNQTNINYNSPINIFNSNNLKEIEDGEIPDDSQISSNKVILIFNIFYLF